MKTHRENGECLPNFSEKKRKDSKDIEKKPGGLANVSEKSDQTGQASNVAMLCLLYCKEVVPSRASSSGSVRGSSVSADQAFHLGHPRPRHVGNPEPNGCPIAMRKITRGYCKLAWKWWRYPKISQFEDMFMGKLMTNYWIWGSCMIFGLKELKPATPIFKFITLIYYLELLEGGRSTCFLLTIKKRRPLRLRHNALVHIWDSHKISISWYQGLFQTFRRPQSGSLAVAQHRNRSGFRRQAPRDQLKQLPAGHAIVHSQAEGAAVQSNHLKFQRSHGTGSDSATRSDQQRTKDCS